MKHNKWKKIIQLVYPMLFMLGVFESFFMIVPFFNLNRYDDLLSNIDLEMFGVHPTVWIESWIRPLLTDFFYLLYAFYFPLPLFIIFWMIKRKMYKQIEESFFILLFTYYGAYIVYFIVPAEGPRYFLAQLQSIPLDGIFFAPVIRNAINFMEPNKLDVFPSLHAAIVVSAMYISYLYNKKIFYKLLPFSIGIIISLVYCRYHYVIDIFAGVLWAGIACFIGSMVFRNTHQYFYPHFDEK